MLLSASRSLAGATDDRGTVDVYPSSPPSFQFCVPPRWCVVLSHVQEEVIPGLVRGLQAPELSDDMGVDRDGRQSLDRHTTDGTCLPYLGPQAQGRRSAGGGTAGGLRHTSAIWPTPVQLPGLVGGGVPGILPPLASTRRGAMALSPAPD